MISLGSEHGGQDELATFEQIQAKLEEIDAGDLAPYRTNPVAIDNSTGALVTASEARADLDAAGLLSPQPGRYSCPGCVSDFSLRSLRGYPFFSHQRNRACRAGFEGPVHACLKLGLHAIGWGTEVADPALGFQYDGLDPATGTVVEVVSSGWQRYLPKVEALDAAGRPHIWIFDSGSRSLATAFKSEKLSVPDALLGRAVVSGLFKETARRLMERIGWQRCLAFYLGLLWRAVAHDRWELVAEDDPLTRAIVGDGSAMHRLALAHNANGQRVTEMDRRGIRRRTWFDRKFRFREKFKPVWDGNRGYVVEEVARLLREEEEKAARATPAPGPGRSEPGEPVHTPPGAEEAARRVVLADRQTAAEAVEFQAVIRLVDAEDRPAVPARLEQQPVSIPGLAEPLVAPVLVTEAAVFTPAELAGHRPQAAPAARPAAAPPDAATRETLQLIAQQESVAGVPITFSKVEGWAGIFLRTWHAIGLPGSRSSLYHGMDLRGLTAVCAAAGLDAAAAAANPQLIVGVSVTADMVRKGSYYGPQNFRKGGSDDVGTKSKD